MNCQDDLTVIQENTEPQINSPESVEPRSEGEDYPHYNVPNEEVEEGPKENVSVVHRVVNCKLNMGGEPVKLVNASELVKILMPDGNVTSKDAAAECVFILFYAKYCTFSSMAAPHFNALPRAFPNLKFAAIDAMRHHIFNTQNGIVGVPTLILFHNGRAISRFNDTEYTLDLFSKFLSKYTGISASEKSYVTSADFAGPVSSTPEKDTDYFLGLSWMFIFMCAVYYFTKSKWWKWIVETVQNTWRESEAQHEHNE